MYCVSVYQLYQFITIWMLDVYKMLLWVIMFEFEGSFITFLIPIVFLRVRSPHSDWREFTFIRLLWLLRLVIISFSGTGRK